MIIDLDLTTSVIKERSEVMLLINDATSGSSITVNVFNSIGLMMSEKTLSPTERSSQISLDVSAFPSGIYFVEVKNENMRMIQKLVKE